jgi:hypothetical protein
VRITAPSTGRSPRLREILAIGLQEGVARGIDPHLDQVALGREQLHLIDGLRGLVPLRGLQLYIDEFAHKARAPGSSACLRSRESATPMMDEVQVKALLERSGYAYAGRVRARSIWRF